MNYYERHLGDYARDTGHLTPLEHGVYNLLLDRYYASEVGIPADQAHRICRARTKEEREAVDAVLAEFFSLDGATYTQGRVEAEIEKARVRIDSARSNGKRGGRPRKNPTGSDSETQQKPNGFPSGSDSETQSKAHQTPDTRHQAPEDQGHVSTAPPSTDLLGEKPADIRERKALRLMEITRDAIGAYNGILGKPKGLLAAVHLVNETRRDQVKRCVRTARQICERIYGSTTITAEFWDSYFAECATDPWKRGDGPYTGEHKNWRPDFEYMTRDEVMTAVFDKAMSEQSEAA